MKKLVWIFVVLATLINLYVFSIPKCSLSHVKKNGRQYVRILKPTERERWETIAQLTPGPQLLDIDIPLYQKGIQFIIGRRSIDDYFGVLTKTNDTVCFTLYVYLFNTELICIEKPLIRDSTVQLQITSSYPPQITLEVVPT